MWNEGKIHTERLRRFQKSKKGEIKDSLFYADSRLGAREWGFSRISVLITDEGTNLRKEEETVGGGKRRNCVDGRDNGCCSAVWVRLSFFFLFLEIPILIWRIFQMEVQTNVMGRLKSEIFYLTKLKLKWSKKLIFKYN